MTDTLMSMVGRRIDHYSLACKMAYVAAAPDNSVWEHVEKACYYGMPRLDTIIYAEISRHLRGVNDGR